MVRVVAILPLPMNASPTSVLHPINLQDLLLACKQGNLVKVTELLASEDVNFRNANFVSPHLYGRFSCIERRTSYMIGLIMLFRMPWVPRTQRSRCTAGIATSAFNAKTVSTIPPVRTSEVAYKLILCISLLLRDVKSHMSHLFYAHR
jgi:hypothetical protein